MRFTQLHASEAHGRANRALQGPKDEERAGGHGACKVGGRGPRDAALAGRLEASATSKRSPDVGA